MTSGRLSKLQRLVLIWLRIYQNRTHRTSTPISSLVRAMPSDKSNISKSLRTLQKKGLIEFKHSPNGRIVAAGLTIEGLLRANKLAESVDQVALTSWIREGKAQQQ